MPGERVEHALLHLARNPEAAQNGFLVRLVGNAEAGLEIHLFAKFAQQLGAERVDGAALDALHTIAQLALQSLGDLTGGLVGECENADSRRFDDEALDEIANALDEAERFSGTWSGEDEERLRWPLDRVSL